MQRYTVPYGYCECGCGQKTTISPYNDTVHGWIRGEPRKVVRGHTARKRSPYEIVDGEAMVFLSGKFSDGSIAIVDVADIERVSQYSWFITKTKNVVYAAARINGAIVRLHRFIMEARPTQIVDHIDRDGLNNRRDNLRFCTSAENGRNVGSKLGESGFRGVYKKAKGGRFEARIKVHPENIYIGTYDTPEEAAIARDKAARELHGEFAVLNFPEQVEE